MFPFSSFAFIHLRVSSSKKNVYIIFPSLSLSLTLPLFTPSTIGTSLEWSSMIKPKPPLKGSPRGSGAKRSDVVETNPTTVCFSSPKLFYIMCLFCLSMFSFSSFIPLIIFLVLAQNKTANPLANIRALLTPTRLKERQRSPL